MRSFIDLDSCEVLLEDEAREMYRMLQKAEPENWEDVDFEDWMNFHIMCGDVKEVEA